jgi:hypothetical protein
VGPTLASPIIVEGKGTYLIFEITYHHILAIIIDGMFLGLLIFYGELDLVKL